jgi:hypothetical protein
MRSGMGPTATTAELRVSVRCGRWALGLGLLGLCGAGLGLSACSGDSGRPPPPVSGIGTDEDPSLTDDAGDDADAGSSTDGGGSDGGGVPADAGPKPDAPQVDDPSVRRLVVSDRAGAILVYDVREASPELPAPTSLKVDAGARVVAGPSGRYAYVFVPGGNEVRVLDVGMHVENGRNVLRAPALLDLSLTGDGVADVTAGSAGAADLAVAFSGASAPLFVSEAALASAPPAPAWPAGREAHRALAFFVGDLALRSVVSAGGASLEVVGSGSTDAGCADPSSVVAHADYALVGCADGLHVLSRSASGVDSERVAAPTSFQLGAANPRFYAVAAADTLLAAPWTADGSRGFEAPLVASAPVAIQLAGPQKNVGVWVLDAAGTLKLYDAAHPEGASEINTDCTTPSNGARPGLAIEGTLAYVTCPATGKLVALSLSDATSEPVLTNAGTTPSDLLVFGYAP